MTGNPLRSEILGDSESTLRLMEDAVSELSGDDGDLEPAATLPPTSLAAGVPDLSPFSELLLGAYGEIVAVLERLRSDGARPCTGAGHPSWCAVDPVSAGLQADMGASDMLQGVQRALRLLDAMEQPDLERAVLASTRGSIREELHRFGMWLQYQEDSARQLTWVFRALADLEQRLYGLASMVGGREDPARAPADVATTRSPYSWE